MIFVRVRKDFIFDETWLFRDIIEIIMWTKILSSSDWNGRLGWHWVNETSSLELLWEIASTCSLFFFSSMHHCSVGIRIREVRRRGFSEPKEGDMMRHIVIRVENWILCPLKTDQCRWWHVVPIRFWIKMQSDLMKSNWSDTLSHLWCQNKVFGDSLSS